MLGGKGGELSVCRKIAAGSEPGEIATGMIMWTGEPVGGTRRLRVHPRVG